MGRNAYLGKVFCRVTVKLEFTDVPDWNFLFWPNLGCIEDVKLEIILLGFWNDLNTKVPLRVGSGFNGLPVGVSNVNLAHTPIKHTKGLCDGSLGLGQRVSELRPRQSCGHRGAV